MCFLRLLKGSLCFGALWLGLFFVAYAQRPSSVSSFSAGTLNRSVLPKIPFAPGAGSYYERVRQCACWQNFPLSIYIQPSAEITSTQWQQIQADLAILNPYFPMFGVAVPQQADIVVTWAERLSDTGDVLGLTTYDKVSSANTLQKVSIQMLLPTHYGKMPDSVLKPAFLHEMGHALGLCEHSDQAADLMAPVIQSEEKHAKRNHLLKTVMMNAIGLPFGIVTLPSPSDLLPFHQKSSFTQRDWNTLYLLYEPTSKPLP